MEELTEGGLRIEYQRNTDEYHRLSSGREEEIQAGYAKRPIPLYATKMTYLQFDITLVAIKRQLKVKP